VIPPGVESEAKAVNSDLDNGYREELGRCSHPKQASKECALADRIASAVPNVKQVVNDVQIKDQKASSSN
jgi:hypothetical protein